MGWKSRHVSTSAADDLLPQLLAFSPTAHFLRCASYLQCTCAHWSQHHGVLSQVNAPDRWHPEWIPDLFVKQCNGQTHTHNFLMRTESRKLMKTGTHVMNGLLGGKQGERGRLQEMVANAISNYLMMGELFLTLCNSLVHCLGVLSILNNSLSYTI